MEKELQPRHYVIRDHTQNLGLVHVYPALLATFAFKKLIHPLIATKESILNYRHLFVSSVQKEIIV